jgi:hypothetical protein
MSAIVILSRAGAARSAASAQSKDLYRQGEARVASLRQNSSVTAGIHRHRAKHDIRFAQDDSEDKDKEA